MNKKLVLFGTGSFAEVAYFMYTHDSDYEIVAFTAHEDYINEQQLMGLPIVPFEKISELYPPDYHDMFVAVGYNDMNQTRASICDQAKGQGYRLATYVSSKCTNWATSIGENTFIFEDNTLQPFVKIGDNVVLWSGNHIGHHTTIGNHCFITSHVVISGNCNVGDYCFIGVNATLRDNISIGESCLVGAGALIMKSTKPKELYVAQRTYPDKRTVEDISI